MFREIVYLPYTQLFLEDTYHVPYFLQAVCGIYVVYMTRAGERGLSSFGKIRYMNFNGCKRKFDVEGFSRRHTTAKRKAVEDEGDGTWAVPAKKSRSSKS